MMKIKLVKTTSPISSGTGRKLQVILELSSGPRTKIKMLGLVNRKYISSEEVKKMNGAEIIAVIGALEEILDLLDD